jgi:hypothetical protein
MQGRRGRLLACLVNLPTGRRRSARERRRRQRTRSHPYAPQLGDAADHHQCSDAEELATPKL